MFAGEGYAYVRNRGASRDTNRRYTKLKQLDSSQNVIYLKVP